MQNHYIGIKNAFLYLASQSNYPTITMEDFNSYCETSGMMNEEDLTQTQIDKIFMAANYDVETAEDNPEKELCRYEFLEIIVRLAIAKYPLLTPAEATEKLVVEYILEAGVHFNLLRFRREQLYCLEVQDLLQTNSKNLYALFMKFKERVGRWLSV